MKTIIKMKTNFHIFFLLLFMTMSGISSLPTESGSKIYAGFGHIEEKPLMKIKRDSDDDDEDDIDCDDPDDEDQFDECDEDDVGEDDDEKWICQCKSNAQHHLVCVRVINPKWSLKCGYGPYPDLTVTCCSSLSISASEPAKSIQGSMMGHYNFYKMGSTGRPIYQNSRNEYLYRGSTGKWQVGSDYTNITASLYHSTCNEECPSSCSNKWRYYDNGWHNDSSINVSCGSRCANLRNEITWQSWSEWTDCKYTNNGPSRRRFSDSKGLRSPIRWEDMDCFSDAIVNGESSTATRRQLVLYNERDYGSTRLRLNGPRVAQVESCKVSWFDELPSLCNSMPSTELEDFCKNSPLWFKCKKKCKQNYATARNYSDCLEFEYRCDDGFCLDPNAISNDKPDCIDGSNSYQKIRSADYYLDSFEKNPALVNDYGWRAPRSIIEKSIYSVQYTHCSKCHGGGTKQRNPVLLSKGSNADPSSGQKTQETQCNTIQYQEGCDHTSSQNQYTHNYCPLLSEAVLNCLDGDCRCYPSRKNQTYPSASDAMQECVKSQTCCGISFNKELKWILRHGDTETTEIQYRKDCFQGNYYSLYCKDQTPTLCQNLLKIVYNNDQEKFEDVYCTGSKQREINCLKTCRRCL